MKHTTCTNLAFDEKSNCPLTVGVGIESSKLECRVSDLIGLYCDDGSLISL
jgi:hypothetical protein